MTDADIDQRMRLVEIGARWCQRVEKVVQGKILTELTHYGPTDDKTFARRVSHVPALLAETNMPAEARTALLAKLDKFIADPLENGFDAGIHQFARLGIMAASRAVALSWFASVQTGITTVGGEKVLRLATLDDAMLPDSFITAEYALHKSLGETGGQTVLPHEAKNWLRELRKTLPAGRVLPEEAEELLTANGVVIAR